MYDVIPSIYRSEQVGSLEQYNGQAFSNILLRIGEVKRIIYPEDKRSQTQKFIEYDIFVSHRENNTAVTKMYQNCLLINPLGSMADKAIWTLRIPESQPGQISDDNQLSALGLGSKVLILCINGEHASAVILGGIRDARDSDKGSQALGHHAEFIFNGVTFSVHDDGSWSLENKGKTAASGAADPKRDTDGAGTVVKVDANGNFTVATQNNKQSIVVDHKAGMITISSENDLTLKGKKIHIGDAADEHAVLGDTLVKLMGQMIDFITAINVPTAVGPSGPPLNSPAFIALKAQLQTTLSTFTFVKKTGP